MGKESELLEACKTGNLSVVERFINGKVKRQISLPGIKRGSFQTRRDDNGYTALHHAALNGHLSIVSLLLSSEAENILLKDSKGCIPLHLACWGGHKDVVKALLVHDPGRRSINFQNTTGETPLHIACHYGHSQIVNLLLQHNAEAVVYNEVGETPLDLASRFGRTEVVRLLVTTRPSLVLAPLAAVSQMSSADSSSSSSSVGANNIGSYGRSGLTGGSGRSATKSTSPGQQSQFWGLKTRLGSPGTDHSALSHHQPPSLGFPSFSPLHLAARHGKVDVCKILIKAGFDINFLTEQGTALHEAALFGRMEVVALLLEAGVDTSIRNCDGFTVVDVLSQHQAKKSVEITQLISSRQTWQQIASYISAHNPEPPGDTSVFDPRCLLNNVSPPVPPLASAYKNLPTSSPSGRAVWMKLPENSAERQKFDTSDESGIDAPDVEYLLNDLNASPGYAVVPPKPNRTPSGSSSLAGGAQRSDSADTTSASFIHQRVAPSIRSISEDQSPLNSPPPPPPVPRPRVGVKQTLHDEEASPYAPIKPNRRHPQSPASPPPGGQKSPTQNLSSKACVYQGPPDNAGGQLKVQTGYDNLAQPLAAQPAPVFHYDNAPRGPHSRWKHTCGPSPSTPHVPILDSTSTSPAPFDEDTYPLSSPSPSAMYPQSSTSDSDANGPRLYDGKGVLPRHQRRRSRDTGDKFNRQADDSESMGSGSDSTLRQSSTRQTRNLRDLNPSSSISANPTSPARNQHSHGVKFKTPSVDDTVFVPERVRHSQQDDPEDPEHSPGHRVRALFAVVPPGRQIPTTPTDTVLDASLSSPNFVPPQVTAGHMVANLRGEGAAKPQRSNTDRDESTPDGCYDNVRTVPVSIKSTEISRRGTGIEPEGRNSGDNRQQGYVEAKRRTYVIDSPTAIGQCRPVIEVNSSVDNGPGGQNNSEVLNVSLPNTVMDPRYRDIVASVPKTVTSELNDNDIANNSGNEAGKLSRGSSHDDKVNLTGKNCDVAASLIDETIATIDAMAELLSSDVSSSTAAGSSRSLRRSKQGEPTGTVSYKDQPAMSVSTCIVSPTNPWHDDSECRSGYKTKSPFRLPNPFTGGHSAPSTPKFGQKPFSLHQKPHANARMYESNLDPSAASENSDKYASIRKLKNDSATSSGIGTVSDKSATESELSSVVAMYPGTLPLLPHPQLDFSASPLGSNKTPPVTSENTDSPTVMSSSGNTLPISASSSLPQSLTTTPLIDSPGSFSSGTTGRSLPPSADPANLTDRGDAPLAKPESDLSLHASVHSSASSYASRSALPLRSTGPGSQPSRPLSTQPTPRDNNMSPRPTSTQPTNRVSLAAKDTATSNQQDLVSKRVASFEYLHQVLRESAGSDISPNPDQRNRLDDSARSPGVQPKTESKCQNEAEYPANNMQMKTDSQLSPLPAVNKCVKPEDGDLVEQETIVADPARTPDFPPPSAWASESKIFQKIMPLKESCKRRSMDLNSIDNTITLSPIHDMSPSTGVLKSTTHSAVMTDSNLRASDNPLTKSDTRCSDCQHNMHDACSCSSICSTCSNSRIDDISQCSVQVRRSGVKEIMAGRLDAKSISRVAASVSSAGSRISNTVSAMATSSTALELIPTPFQDWIVLHNLQHLEEDLIRHGFDNLQFMPLLTETLITELFTPTTLSSNLCAWSDSDRAALRSALASLARTPGSSGLPETARLSAHAFVSDWVNSLDADPYLGHLMRSGYDTVEKAKLLTEFVLLTIGIDKKGYRLRILWSLVNPPKEKQSNGTLIENTSEETWTVHADPLIPTKAEASPTQNRGAQPDDKLSRIRQSLMSFLDETVGTIVASSSCRKGDRTGSEEYILTGLAPQPRNQDQPTTEDNKSMATSDKTVDVLDDSIANRIVETRWRHDPKTLTESNISYTAHYLGSQLVNPDGGTTYSAAMTKIKNDTRKITKVPRVVLEISYKGVCFKDAESSKLICEHPVHEIERAVQDDSDLNCFAYIAIDDGKHFCHVFSVLTADLATEVILTLGQAFEVAYQMALKESVSNTGGGTSTLTAAL